MAELSLIWSHCRSLILPPTESDNKMSWNFNSIWVWRLFSLSQPNIWKSRKSKARNRLFALRETFPSSIFHAELTRFQRFLSLIERTGPNFMRPRDSWMVGKCSKWRNSSSMRISLLNVLHDVCNPPEAFVFSVRHSLSGDSILHATNRLAGFSQSWSKSSASMLLKSFFEQKCSPKLSHELF